MADELPMSDELTRLDATAQAELVRSGQVSPRELVEAAIQRLEKLGETLGCLVTPLFEHARRQAVAPDLADGPFRGVPFLVKDLICTTAGVPLFQGNRALRDAGHRATQESFLATRFRKAGLVTIGRTRTPEFGFSVTTEPSAFGPSRNPWNLEHSTGGSSGGSAAAVAARIVPLAHANDGGGSIRIPASECGLVGLKPSRGRVSLGPDYGEFWRGLVAEGVVSLSVRDTAAILDAVSGLALGDPYTAPAPQGSYAEQVGREPGRLRIGWMNGLPGGTPGLHPECQSAVEAAARQLESLGHTVVAEYPAALAEEPFGQEIQTVLVAHAARTVEEAGVALGRTLGPDDVERYTWHLVERGRDVSAARYIAAGDWLHAWSRRMADWWAGGFDLLLTPTLAAPPPRLGELADAAAEPPELLDRILGLIPFTPAFNVTGQPAVSLPLHWTGEGLPVGVQLVAPYGREDVLIRVSSQLEGAAPWLERRPPVCA